MNLLIRYRLFILTLIAATQIFSSVLFVPGGAGYGASVFRIILLLTGGALLLTVGFRYVSVGTRRALLGGSLLFGWMVLSMAWTSDLTGAVRQLSYVATTLVLIYVLEVLVRTVSDFKWLTRTIGGLGAGIFVFALYELQTGNHFPSALLQLDDYNQSLAYVTEGLAWFTFGNPNDLAVHLIFCCFLMVLFFSGRNLLSVTAVLFVGAALWLADRMEARMTFLAMFTFIGLYFTALSSRWSISGARFAGAATIGAVAILCLGLMFIDQAEFIDRSTFIRLQLMASALEMSNKTLFLGVGTGAFEAQLSLRGMTQLTYGIVNPHNAFGRILAENGIIGLLLLGHLIFGPISVVVHAGRTTRLGSFVIAATVGLFLLLFVSSDPLSSSSLQFAIAVLWVAARLAAELTTGPVPVSSPRERIALGTLR